MISKKTKIKLSRQSRKIFLLFQHSLHIQTWPSLFIPIVKVDRGGIQDHASSLPCTSYF